MGTEEPCIKTIQYWIIPRWGEWRRHHFSYPPNAIFENPATNSGKERRSMIRFSTFPLPQGGVDSSVRPMRTFQFDLNEVMDGMKRRENVLAAHCSLFELNKTCGKRAPQNFLSEIFLAQSQCNLLYNVHCILEKFDNWGRSTGISEVRAILKIRRLMEVKWGKSFILFYEAVELLRIRSHNRGRRP